MKITLLDKCEWKGWLQLSLDPGGPWEMEKDEWRRGLRLEKRNVSESIFSCGAKWEVSGQIY